jgi:hypothetical protein
MNINPSNPTAMQLPSPDKCDHLMMGNSVGLKHLFVGQEELLAATPIADKKFPIHQLVAGHFVKTE